VARLESVRIAAAIAAKHDLKLWRLDFVGAYLNSTTKEDIYVRQAEGFIELGFEDHVAKLLHTLSTDEVDQLEKPIEGKPGSK
jgi:hypothetical protein